MAKLRKLHRSTNHSMIAGVLGGIAEYYGWSPNMLRFIVIFIIVASAAVTLPGFMLVYVLLMLLMPRATAASYEQPLERTVN